MLRLEDPFIFCVGGEDDRKNVEGLLKAFALLPPDLRAAHQLVVAFGMTEGYRRHLEGLARRLGIARRSYLPGYIDDPTLIAAYQSTDLFVFPSHYEGYGLPVAEAMACGALVVSSNISASAAFTAPEGQFDPADPADMAASMERALTDRASHLASRRASGRHSAVRRGAPGASGGGPRGLRRPRVRHRQLGVPHRRPRARPQAARRRARPRRPACPALRLRRPPRDPGTGHVPGDPPCA